MSMPLPPLHPRSTDRRLRYTRSEFESCFPRESDLVERKSGTGNKPIQEALVALSNSAGGVVLIGVRDNGLLQGRRLSGGTEAAIHEAAGCGRDLAPYEINEIDVDGVAVVAVGVGRRTSGVAQTSDGRVLVRRGARNVPLFGTELLAFLQQQSQELFEATSSNVSIDASNSQVLAEIANAYGWHDQEITERLEERGLKRRDSHDLTVAGALFLARPSPRRFAKAVIEVRRYRDETVNYDRRETFSGPLHHQVSAAATIVMQELGTELLVGGVFRYEIPRLPAIVVREALANAVAHRAYDMSGTATVVELRPGRVEITSPGGLPEGVTEDNLRTAQSARNPYVIDVLRRFKLAEDAGRGIDQMQDSMAEALLEAPTFRDTGSSFTVILLVQGLVTNAEKAWVLELESRGTLQGVDKVLIVHAARGHVLTNGRVRELTGLDSRDARAVLRRLRDTGILQQSGERGGATYRLTADFAPPGLRHFDLRTARRLVLAAAAVEPITNAAVRRTLNLDAETTRALLRVLVQRGDLRAEGKTRDRQYVLIKPSRRQGSES